MPVPASTPRPRRVLAVVAAPTFGGATNQVLRLHGPLLERGWELVPVLPDEPGNAAERLADGGIDVLRLEMRRARATRSPGPHVALARHVAGDIAALRRLVRQQRAAVVQNHGDLNPQAGIAGHLEGAAVHWQLLDSRTPAALRRVTMPLVTRLADSMSVVGLDLARSHPGVLDLGERCTIIYAPADPDVFADALACRGDARAELGVPDGAVCIGAIGNRNPQKGHQWLVRAAARARQHDPRIVVRILGAASPGHDDYERGLRDEAAAGGLSEADGSFRIVDPGARVPELIGAFDVLCMSSVPYSEGIPTVILEAMIVGLPVLATDVGAVAEVVVDGATGRVVPANDAEALAAALRELAGDEGLRARLGAAGQVRVRESFGVERLVDLYAAGYEHAVRHRATRRRRAALDAFG